jgi:arginyl-tRNA synthetase
MLKTNLTKYIQAELQAKYAIKEIILQKTSNPKYGDYTTNISFQLTKTLKNKPQLIAEEICDHLNQSPPLAAHFSFSALNGFINIKLKDSYLFMEFHDFLDPKTPHFPHNNQKILLEYVSANPTGPLHIGHGRWAVLGNVLANLLEFIQIPVKTEFYINDAGNQVDLFYQSIKACQNKQPLPENGYHGHYIKTLAKLEEDPLQHQINDQKQTLTKLGVTFSNWYSEKSIHENNKVVQAIETLTNHGYTYQKENALWFKSSDFGDEKDRVLIKADGAYTYFAVDIAYHQDKFKRGFHTLINIWGADHHGYIARLKAALKALCPKNYAQDHNFQIIIGQLVSLFRDGQPVRMSKRTGEIITLNEVIQEIGPDAVRFFLIQKSADTHLDFDLELAKKKTFENPVYYIQYAHARICSILSKANHQTNTLPTSFNLEEKERNLVLLCLQVHEEVYDATLNLTPHKVANYLQNLAKCFHNFYESCPIIKADPDTQQKRLYIIHQVKSTLALCLNLLGISAPQKM